MASATGRSVVVDSLFILLHTLLVRFRVSCICLLCIKK